MKVEGLIKVVDISTDQCVGENSGDFKYWMNMINWVSCWAPVNSYIPKSWYHS
jgi:hypothetical protein